MLLYFIGTWKTLQIMQAQIGDKIRLKAPPNQGKRGVVVNIGNGTFTVRAEGKNVEAAADVVTNLSLAARKAWQSMPDRRVGRPKGTRLCDRVSVTLRIDRDLWQQFRELEATGEVEDRTATINGWLRDKLEELKSNGNAS